MRWGRRILGWVWGASIVASTLLFVAAVGMWGTSYWRSEGVAHRSVKFDQEVWWSAVISRGSLSIASSTSRSQPLPPSQSLGWSLWSQSNILMSGGTFVFGKLTPEGLGTIEVPWLLRQAGITWDQYDIHEAAGGPVTSHMAVVVPLWSVALLGLLLPTIHTWRWRKKRRVAREGLCKVCGYDLRASVERCPECGTAIEARSVAS